MIISGVFVYLKQVYAYVLQSVLYQLHRSTLTVIKVLRFDKKEVAIFFYLGWRYLNLAVNLYLIKSVPNIDQDVSFI